MRQYELVTVLAPNLEELAVAATLEKLSGWISSQGGTITAQEKWGIKKLAYPIKRFTEGQFVLTRFQGEPQLSRELESNLKFSEEVLRYLLVKAEYGVVKEQ